MADNKDHPEIDGDWYYDAEEEGWCDQCQNTGWVECYCGGDLCVCENNGETPCPVCNRD